MEEVDSCFARPAGARGVQSGKKRSLENGSVILNVATGHTQLNTYLEIGRRGGGGGRGDEGAAKGAHKWECFLCGARPSSSERACTRPVLPKHTRLLILDQLKLAGCVSFCHSVSTQSSSGFGEFASSPPDVKYSIR